MQFPEDVEAMAESLTIHDGKPQVTGWVVPVERFQPPFRVAQMIGDTVLDFGVVEAVAPEASARIGHYGFKIAGQLPWPPKLTKGQSTKLILVAASGAWVPLPVAPRQSPLVHDYRNERAFIAHVQSNSGRPQDKETVAFHARQFVIANPDRPMLQAGALTVLGYRVLDNSWTEEGAAQYCIDLAQPVLDELASAENELGFRWFISLSLLCHYLHLSRGDRSSGLPRLRQAHERRSLLAISPPQGTNLLKATFHLGSGLWKAGQEDDATEVMLSAKETFRTAASLWRFENYHSASELVTMSQLVRACLVWLETAKHSATGMWGHASYAAAPQNLSEFVCLGFPAINFLRQGLL